MGVLCHDGLRWQVALFTCSDGVWQAGECGQVDGRNNRQLPPELGPYLASAGSVRVLVPNEPRLESLVLPEDLLPEETHSAMAYAMLEDDPNPARFAAARAELYGMGADESQLLINQFGLRQMGGYEKALAEFGCRFEAVGSLEVALLDWHALRAPAERLLFVGTQTSFYAVPGRDSSPFMASVFPLGMTVPVAAHRDRMERVIQRITSNTEYPLRVVLSDGIDPAQQAWLEESLASLLISGWSRFSEIKHAVMVRAVQGPVGGVDSTLAWVGPPPPPQDPHRHGTVLCCAVISVALLFLGSRWHALHAEWRDREARQVAWDALQLARQDASAQFKHVQENQLRLKGKLRQLAEKSGRLPDGVLPVLKTLALEVPAYSRIVSLTQMPAGGWTIRGITLWQTEVSRINDALTAMAKRENMTLEIKKVSAAEGQRVQQFEFSIKPQDGRL